MKELPETHLSGMISIENIKEVIPEDSNLIFGDLGIQISSDERIWICINGVAFLRFKPLRKEPMEFFKK